MILGFPFFINQRLSPFVLPPDSQEDFIRLLFGLKEISYTQHISITAWYSFLPLNVAKEALKTVHKARVITIFVTFTKCRVRQESPPLSQISRGSSLRGDP